MASLPTNTLRTSSAHSSPEAPSRLGLTSFLLAVSPTVLGAIYIAGTLVLPTRLDGTPASVQLVNTISSIVAIALAIGGFFSCAAGVISGTKALNRWHGSSQPATYPVLAALGITLGIMNIIVVLSGSIAALLIIHSLCSSHSFC